MSQAKRFFRKYLCSSLGILLVFLTVNLVLFLLVSLGAMQGLPRPNSPTRFLRELAGELSLEDGQLRESDWVQAGLERENAWAMLLDGGGEVIWEARMPESLPRHYTPSQVASFSRWYLEDWPVFVWEHPAGLLVVGYPAGSYTKYTLSYPEQMFRNGVGGALLLFALNLLLLLGLFWRSTRRVERAVTPILDGIGQLAAGQPVELAERGELRDICRSLNRAGEQVLKKDRARAEWIGGVSHDIRTPLSMVLGYAGELEEDGRLPPDAREEAGVIRRQGERLRSLVSDLNLASKLEYAMQPMNREQLSPAELARQAVSELLNGGLDARYPVEVSCTERGERAVLSGDPALLRRMLDNLLQNSIRHNPAGCRITVEVDAGERACLLRVGDTGSGLTPGQLERGNGRTDGAGGLGLKLVRQIAQVHGGTVSFENHGGLWVTVELPITE